MDLNTYWSPDLARQLPVGSKERSLAQLALRNLWHTLFDQCPQVLSLSPGGQAMMDSFLIWANQNKLSMSWSLHIHLLNWLIGESIWQDQITDHHKKELLVSALMRWNLEINVDTGIVGMAVASPHLNDLGIAILKSEKAAEDPKFLVLKISDDLFPKYCAYAISYKQEGWNRLNWIDLPS